MDLPPIYAGAAREPPAVSLLKAIIHVMEVQGFEIKKTIGRGGMGTAYLAIQESLDRQVVLKTMNTAQAEQTDFLERFLNEGRIVAALRHPHIITIFDIGATSDVVYMSMEYIEGGDLKDRIPLGFTVDQALNVIESVASALHYAHGQGVIHRDVKPANILFSVDSKPLLSDFGIAKQTTVDAELTSTGTILGSPFYMSPEQAEGQQVDGRADIYSLGIIFYEMLTGVRPYPGDSAIKIIVQHIQAPIPTLPDEFKAYQQLLNFLIAKNREDRFESAGDVVAYIQEMRDKATRASRAAVEKANLAARRPTGFGGFLSAYKRTLALFAMIIIIVGAYGAFYYYTQSMAIATFAMRTPPANTADSGDGATTQATAQTQSSGANEEDVVEALEWLAQTRLKQDMLTDPPADNAHYYYSRLLQLDQKRAQGGFVQIAERFVVLAEKEFSDSNFRQAQTYITLGLQVQSSNEGLLTLQSFIDTRDRSILEHLLAHFTAND
jgi:serine/threonine protein kinase